MYLQDTMVHYFIVMFIKFEFSALCHSHITKTKTVQSTLVLQCSQNYAIYIRHSILYQLNCAEQQEAYIYSKLLEN